MTRWGQPKGAGWVQAGIGLVASLTPIPVAGARDLGMTGSVSDPECVLDPGVHASYPFLVEDEGTIFMLPETSAARELVL